jgi:hypothetical protein
MDHLSYATSQDYDESIQMMEEYSAPERSDSFDFVMVEIEADDEIMTQGSFDYCDDEFSTLSDHHGFMEDLSESVLEVPDVLMRDLDDAHAAAKLVGIDEVAFQHHDEAATSSSLKTDQCSSTSSVVSVEEVEKEKKPSPRKVSIGGEMDDVEANHGIQLSSTRAAATDCKSQDAPAPSLKSETKDHSFKSGQANFSMGSDATNTGPTSICRTSNKKRRKKLKLMKKEQARASAARQLAAKNSESTNSRTTASSATSKASKATAKSRSKTATTNIAVACATETMAAYRGELLLRGIK